MAEVLEEIETPPMALEMGPVKLTEDEFFQFCARNHDWRIERAANGDILIMWPAGPAGSSGNAELTFQFKLWARKDKTGRVFDSSAGFILFNKAMRSPDVAWVRIETLKTVHGKDRERFLPLCPDFVLELRSRSDRMPALHAKMEEYIECGARLGWLLDSVHKTVFIYRPGREREELIDPSELSGEGVLKGFVLDVRQVWEAMEW